MRFLRLFIGCCEDYVLGIIAKFAAEDVKSAVVTCVLLYLYIVRVTDTRLLNCLFAACVVLSPAAENLKQPARA